MRDKQVAGPYGSLGEELRGLRNKACETLADTSAAVEIEINQLAGYELGKSRPTEETLLLLINHFKPRDTLALKLWKLAGYSADETDSGNDTPAAYTDTIEVNANQFGVIVDFKQNGAMGELIKTIAKVGMSREHAQTLIKTLAIALARTDPTSQPQDTDSDLLDKTDKI